MRISKNRNRQRQVAYTVELSEYDAEPPSRQWLFDDLPEKINPELEAVALYLVFGPWCGGELTVPQKMGPNTAAAIRRHAGFDFFPGPIEFYPKPLPRGNREMRLSDRVDHAGPSTLVSVSGAEWNGSLRSTASTLVSSNTVIFSQLQGIPTAAIAPAVLLADELNIGTILFSENLNAREECLLVELLQAVGLSALPNSTDE